MPRRRLPPLHSLRAFEAAGRHLSFGRAAEELLLTPGAISHHVRRLEAELGTALFVRTSRAVQLTAAGVSYLDTVRQSLDLLAQGTEAIRMPRRDFLRISLLSSFATNWLLARLPRFEAAHPGIEVVFEPTTRHADFASDPVDLAIRYGPGGWPGVEARMFLLERLAPVCAPALLRRGPPITAAADVLAHPCLLSFAKEPFEWLAWAAASGIDWGGARTRMLHDYNIVLEAALAGQGVAMGRRTLMGDRMRRGGLVEPLGPAIPLGGIGHWLVSPPGGMRPAAAAFAGWIEAEAGSVEPD